MASAGLPALNRTSYVSPALTRPMARTAARPRTTAPHRPASMLACRALRHGSVLSRALSAVAASQQRGGHPPLAAAAGGGSQAAPPGAPPSQPPSQPIHRLSVLAAGPTATQLLAHFFACELHPSDCYLLYGSVGVGKSYFSRAFIRAAAGNEDLPVPSPTFLLQNIYTDHAGPPIHHFDLYRLAERYDLARLDLPASFSQAVCLVEWAERLALLEEEEGSSQSDSSANGSSSSSLSSNGSGSQAGTGSGENGSREDGSAAAGPGFLPREPLAVHISIVEGAEQAELQALVQQQRGQQQQLQQDAAAGSRLQGQQAEEEEEEAEEWGSSSDEESSGDLRWRRIELEPCGARWQPRLQLLRRYLQQEGPQLGCYLLGERQQQEGEEGAAAAGGRRERG